MIKQTIKLMWHRKSRNFLLMVEISISFLILFAIGSIIIYNYSNYYENRGFEYKNVWVLSLDWKDLSKDEVREKLILIKQYLKNTPEINQVALVSNNYPYTYHNMNCGLNGIRADFMECEDEYFEIMGISTLQGRTFSFDDNTKQPIVINKMLADKLFPGENPIGKTTELGVKVVGLIGPYRDRSSYDNDRNYFFERISLQDTSLKRFPKNLIFDVLPGTGKEFEVKMMKEVGKLTVGWDKQISTLEDARKEKDKLVWLPVMILIVISSFLILNVVLGLFGLLWYSINQRKAEFGLRRAMGARCVLVTRQVVYEILAVSSFAIIGGLIIAIQFPILGLFEVQPYIYTISIILSALLIYGLTALCAYLPAKQASMIQPIEALREE